MNVEMSNIQNYQNISEWIEAEKKKSQTSNVNVNTKQVLIKWLPKLNEFQLTSQSAPEQMYSTISAWATMDLIQKRYHDYHHQVESSVQSFSSLYRKHCWVVSIQKIIIEITVCWLAIRFQNLHTKNDKKEKMNLPERSNCFYVVKSVLCFGILYNVCIFVCRISLCPLFEVQFDFTLLSNH